MKWVEPLNRSRHTTSHIGVLDSFFVENTAPKAFDGVTGTSPNAPAFYTTAIELLVFVHSLLLYHGKINPYTISHSLNSKHHNSVIDIMPKTVGFILSYLCIL